MAEQGEERLLTLYADVHYYFTEPGPRPTHHRFDKESYVYLYREERSGRGRIEIANHAGTAEQDAFTGYLDNIMFHQSFKHPNLCTVTVNGSGNKAIPDHHWRLPSTDPRDEGSYLFKIHTMDLYFWTEADAAQFVHLVASCLRQEQLQVEGMPVAPPAAHEHPMSPVVQNLEHLAISHDSTPAPRAQQAPSVQPTPVSKVGSPLSDQNQQRDEHAYVPIAAYNPAAPAAPEKIAHREKTPPPPDAAEGTGLTAAAARDYSSHHPLTQPAPSSLSPQANPSFGPRAPPSFGPGATPSFGPGAPSTITPQPGAQHGLGSPAPSSTFSPAPTTASSTTIQQPMTSSHTSPPTTTGTAAPSFPGPPGRTFSEQSATSSTSMAQPTPTTEILGPNFGHSPVPLQHLQPQYPDYLGQRVAQNTPPASQSPGYHAPGPQAKANHLPENVRIGGYSDYNYGASTAAGPGVGLGAVGLQQQAVQGGGYHDANPYQTGDYAVHQQLYRPTEDELAAHKGHGGRKHKDEGDARPGRLEAGAEKVEKKVNKFLRGLEKRIG